MTKEELIKIMNIKLDSRTQLYMPTEEYIHMSVQVMFETVAEYLIQEHHGKTITVDIS